MNQRKVGALLSYISLGINMLAGFIYVPIMLKYLSKSEYGLYELIGSMIAYLAIMDFGLSGMITRYYSQAIARNDEVAKENILALSSVIYGVITIIIGIVGGGIYQFLDTFYGSALTFHEMELAKEMYIVLLINIMFTIPANIFVAIIQSNEKFIFLRSITIMQGCLKPIVIILVLSHHASALSLVYVNTIFNLLVIMLNSFYCFYRLHAKIRFHFFEPSLAREMLIFSFYIFLTMVVDQIYLRTGQIILGAAVGTAAVAVYGIAIRIYSVYIAFSTAINSVFLPQLSEMAAKSDDMTRINELFVRVGRIQCLILGFMLSAFMLFGQEFIEAWAGKEFLLSYHVALILMLPATIPLIQNMGILVLQAKNKHAFRSKIYLILACLNIPFTFYLSKMYGEIGCAASAALLSFIGGGIIINIYYHKVVKIDILHFFHEIMGINVPIVLSLLLGYCFNYFIGAHGLAWMIIKTIGFALIYVFFIIVFGLNAYEKNLLLSPVKSYISK